MTLASVRAYRESMAEFAQMGTMDIWYARSEQELMAGIKALRRGTEKTQRKEMKNARRAPKKAARKAHTRDSLQALSKLAELVDGPIGS